MTECSVVLRSTADSLLTVFMETRTGGLGPVWAQWSKDRGLLAERPDQFAHGRRIGGRGGPAGFLLVVECGRRVDDVGVADRRLRVGEGGVGLVAEEGVQEVAREEGAGGAGGFRFVFAAAERGEQAATFGEAVGAGAFEGAQDRRARPSRGQWDRVGVEGVDIGDTGQDQDGRVDIGGRRFGGRSGGGREQRGDRGHAALGGGENGRAGAHTVAGEGQTFGMHGDSAVAEADAGADIEGGEQVGGQVQVGGQRAAFGVRRGGDDAPGREVFQQRGVVTGAVEPAVAEGDGR